METSQYESSAFLTLTFDEEHRRSDHSVYKDDLKRVWRSMYDFGRRTGEFENLRYYGVGEYGLRSQREHYHIMLFGLPCTSALFHGWRYNFRRDQYEGYLPFWSFGFCTVAPYNDNRGRYIAGYVTKKLKGTHSDDWYAGRNREFAIMSRRPGIGFSAYECHIDEIRANRGTNLGRKCVPIPAAVKRKFFSDEKPTEERNRCFEAGYGQLVSYSNYLDSLPGLNKVCDNLKLRHLLPNYDDFFKSSSGDADYWRFRDRQTDMNAQAVRNFMANLQRKEKI